MNFFKGNIRPVRVTCPHCRQNTLTVVHTKLGSAQWLGCLVLCLLGMWCCCCIPMCIDSWQDGTHSCGHCGYLLGRIGYFEQ